MNANTYTINDIEKAVKDTGYKYVSLVKPNGAQVISFNSGKITADQRLNEIRRRLESKTLPDGLYIVLAKSALNIKTVPDEFPFQKGKPQTMAENTPVKTEKSNPEVTSFSEVLKLKNRITELEFENKALQKTIDDLEEQIEELEEQLDEQPETLQENGQNDFLNRAGEWLQKTLITVQPLIDKHFELKEMQIKNETARLMIAQQKPVNFTPQKTTPKPEPQADAVNYTIGKITKFIESYAANGDIDKYEALASIYNNAESLDDFYQKLDNYDKTTFQNLIEFINAKN